VIRDELSCAKLKQRLGIEEVKWYNKTDCNMTCLEKGRWWLGNNALFSRLRGQTKR